LACPPKNTMLSKFMGYFDSDWASSVRSTVRAAADCTLRGWVKARVPPPCKYSVGICASVLGGAPHTLHIQGPHCNVLLGGRTVDI
jgi:hypothetical protein